jgi:pyruvate carboxylase
VAALEGGDRDPGLDHSALRQLSTYWEGARRYYRAFESEMRSGASSVYDHGMPGGQFTNLQEQARSLGLAGRWPEVEKAYAQVNKLFGDIVKVTPTSKVVGDLALTMVSNGLTPEDIENPKKEIAFPASVIALFRGEVGQPYGGFPEALQKKILKGEQPLTGRRGALLPPADLAAVRAEAEKKARRQVSETELSSYLMYPEVFVDYAAHRRAYSDTSVLPTSVYFYGLEAGQEVAVEIERGKILIISFLAVSEPDDDGQRTLFFELNGQPRTVKVLDKAMAASGKIRRKADAGDATQVGAPMPGMIVNVCTAGSTVKQGDRLFTIEAMKMETAVYADIDARIAEVVAATGQRVEPHDLVMVLEAV